MNYQPNDIQTLEYLRQKTGLHQYLGVFGKSEYEWIMGKIVEASQQAGQWIAVDWPFLKDDHPSYAGGEASHLGQMVNNGLLELENGKYKLTYASIQRLARKYPVRNL